MNKFRKTYNPYLKGLRPKRFFSKRIELGRKEIMLSDLRKFNPDWTNIKRA